MYIFFFFLAKSMLLGKTKFADNCAKSREQLRALLLRSMASPSVLQVLVTEHNRGSGMFENQQHYPCVEGVDALTKLVESTILESQQLRSSMASTAAPFVLVETRLVAGEGAPNRNVMFAIERKLEEVVVVEERKTMSSSSSSSSLSKRGSGQGLLIFTIDKTEQTMFFPLER